MPGTALAGGKGGARTRLQPLETLVLGPTFGRVNSGTRTQLWPRKQQHKDPTPVSGNGGARVLILQGERMALGFELTSVKTLVMDMVALGPLRLVDMVAPGPGSSRSKCWRQFQATAGGNGGAD